MTKTALEKITPEGFPSVQPTVIELQSPKSWQLVFVIEYLGIAGFFLGILGILLLPLFFIKNFNQPRWLYGFPLISIWFLATLIPFSSSINRASRYSSTFSVISIFCFPYVDFLCDILVNSEVGFANFDYE